MSQTDPTQTDPEVYLLQSPLTYRINPLTGYVHKYAPVDVSAYVVFAKTRKPKYNSINPVSEVAQIVCFPFYAPCSSHLDSEFHFDFPGDTKNYFAHWRERFAQYFERPVLSVGMDSDCRSVLDRVIHYSSMPHYRFSLCVPSWSREKIWSPLVQKYGWTSTTTSPQMKAALLPIMEKAVLEWETVHNPNSYLQSAIGKKQTKSNYGKIYSYFPEIEKYDYEPSSNYALDA